MLNTFGFYLKLARALLDATMQDLSCNGLGAHHGTGREGEAAPRLGWGWAGSLTSRVELAPATCQSRLSRSCALSSHMRVQIPVLRWLVKFFGQVTSVSFGR